jgi:nucleotide sugar dehydrogenase
MSNNISIFGVGKLGLCFALNLESKGFDVLGVDISEDYVELLNTKALTSSEEGVNELLSSCTKFKATTNCLVGLKHSNLLFVLVATPSLPNGKYDHTQLVRLVEELKSYGRQEETKELIIGCTVMPEFCDQLQADLERYNYNVSYNPEFIAQGTVIRDQLYPDMVLIGSRNEESADKIKSVYERLVENKPTYATMAPISAEICKIALNCFITTKIAFTNMVGDLATKVGGEPQSILDAIGADQRVGSKCTRYGYGYGGPCFPRDNRALGVYAKEQDCSIHISDATDECNADHLKFMVDNFVGDEAEFTCVTYKPESTILEESQQLAYAVALAKRGVKVTISERPEVMKELKKLYGGLFNYASV